MNGPDINSMINGVVTDYLNINDRAIHYGDGLFETILCSNKKIYYWKQHYQRLLLSSKKLKICCPDEQLLLDDISSLMSVNNAAANSSLALKIIVTRGAGERGYKFSKGITANRIVLLSSIEQAYSSLLSSRLLTGELVLCQQQVSINQNLAGIKHLNRLENVLARNEWHDADNTVIDGLMLNADQHVIEGSMSNLFAVKNNQLFTPLLTQSGVNGIMRDAVIDIAQQAGIAVSAVNISLDELQAMDELFISNSLIGIKSVSKFIDRRYGQADVTKLIFQKLLETKNDYVQVI